MLARISGKSDPTGAMRYALALWPQLTRYRDDRRLEIDNNAAERAIRAIALGRRNWLFAGSHGGRERTATIYTLIETGRLNGIDPEVWLRDFLARIATRPAKRLADLLPWIRTVPSPEQARAA